MPEMAKILFDQCFAENRQLINYGFINDVFYQINDLTFEKFIERKKLEAEEKNRKNILNVANSNSEEKVELIIHDIKEIGSNNDDVEASKFKEEHFLYTVGTHPLTLMITHERFSLLSHPLVDSYIELKWNRFAKWGYYSLCMYYLFIASALTVLTIISKSNNKFLFENKENSTKIEKESGTLLHKFPGSIILITVIFILQCALLRLRLSYPNFDFKKHWFDIITFILTCFYVIIEFVELFINVQPQWDWDIIVVLNFFASLTLLNYIKKHPRFGVYVIMITYVFTSFLRFAPIFIMVLLPFVVLFYVLLGEGSGLFAFFDTFIHTLVMMIGEFDYKDSVSSKNSYITSAMFCLFLFAITIFLMNLLTGLAVSDTTKILQEAFVTRKIMQIETIHHIEMIMPEWIRKKYWAGYCKDPKEINEIEKETHRFTSSRIRKLFKLWGMSKDAAKQIDNGNAVADKVDALEQKMDHSINSINDKIGTLNEKIDAIVEMLKRR